MSASDTLQLIEDMSLKILNLPPTERGKVLKQLKEKVLNETKQQFDSAQKQAEILQQSLIAFDE